MKNTNYHKLDNPVWYSLTEYQQKHTISFENIKFYPPDYCAFGGFTEIENISDSISEYSKLSDNFLMDGKKLPSK